MRKLILGLFGALLFTTAAACAPADSIDDEPGLAPQDDDPELTLGSDIGMTQTPPVKVLFESAASRYLALVATNTAVGTTYAAKTEYWFAPATLAPPAVLDLSAAPIDLTTEAAISDFVRPLDPAFSTPRVVPPTAWTHGALTFREGDVPYLYSTTHPDDSGNYLGFIVVLDRAGRLVSTGWYRSMAPDSTGRAFTSQLWSQTLRLAVDERGAPTVDPNAIGRGDWYGILMTPQ